jgi:hypothetical protein
MAGKYAQNFFEFRPFVTIKGKATGTKPGVLDPIRV